MAVEQKVKLLCSFGGRILPRAGDGALRYVGGQTRIISVPRDISFSDLMIKVSAACGGCGGAAAPPLALRYQLPDEDLDALVSVSSADDLANMIDEYDKLAASSSPGPSPKLRAFLFSDPPNGSKARADDSVSTPGSASSPRVETASNLSSPVLRAVDPAWPETPPAPLDYVEAQPIQYMNSNTLGAAGGAPYQAILGPPASQVSNLKPVEGYPYGVSVVQPVSQLPPLRVGYFRPQFEQYGGLMPREQMVRLEDCFMCHKDLPHAHSDTLVPDHGHGSPVCTPRTSPMFYSHHSEDMSLRAPVNPMVEHSASRFSQVAQYDMERLALQKREDLACPGAWLPPDSIGPLVDGQSPRMVFLGNNQQSGFVHPWPQQLLLNQQPNLGPPQYHVEQEPVAIPLAVNANYASSVANENLLASQPSLQGTVPEYSYNYVGQMDGMVGALRISPVETTGSNEQCRAVVQPNVGTPMELKPSISPLAVENNCDIRTQVGGNGIFSGGGGIVPDGSHLVKPIDLVPPAYVNVAPLHNLQPAATGNAFYMMGSHGPFPLNLGTGFEPPAPSDKLLGIPAHSFVVNPKKTTDADRGDVASQLCCKDMLNYIPDGQPLTNIMSPNGLTAPFEELSSPNSLFYNEDPWKVLGGTQLLPHKPSEVDAKEPAISNNLCINNKLQYRNGSDMIALIEEGVLHQLPNLATKSLRPDHVQQTKEELQSSAEEVAASAFPSAVLPIPSLANETEEHVGEINKEGATKDDIGETKGATALVHKKVEDIMTKLSDKTTQHLQASEEFGHLQIIKNSDLEELRELGSGTFGTVYHGKWRGSDVAIKRINERCFTGKASEQERMRNDFWNEACKLSDLHHPNVVAFYGVVLDGPGGSIATVTEYMVNGSLRNSLQKNDKTFGHRKRLLVAMDVAFGMEYLHEKKIVHFDLKSDNLLVNLRDPQRPICKVGDLGLSKVKCKTLISGGVRGTLPWMAPELLNGFSSLVSEKVDVFSFGIVMWELLTGEEPYADLHYGAIIGGILSNTLRPPVPGSCDPKWRSLMEECWSSEPSERPSFTKIADSLRSMAACLELKGQTQTVQPTI